MEHPLETAANVSSKIIEAAHPYYPVGIEVVGYLANKWSVPFLLGTWTVGCLALWAVTFKVTKTIKPNISNGDMWTVLWFVLSGSIHLFFEGYYSYNQAAMGELQTLFGQLWKEYALSDSRYLTQNAFVLCMETVTAVFWGPGCWISAYMIVYDHPLRYPVQAIVSLGQFYGDILYYATSLFDHYLLGISYSRPEACYYWGYYVLMNFFWIVIPMKLLIDSTVKTGEAFRIAARVKDAQKVR